MLPVHRWSLCLLGALLGGATFAQTAASQPEVDESKIPEWVKRQARSPYKVIIESNSVRAKPVPPKPEDSTKQAARKAPLKPASTNAAAAELAKTSTTPTEAASAPSPADAAPITAAAQPAASVPTPVVAAAPPPAAPAATPVEVAARPEPAGLAEAAATPSEPASLTLLKRVEPVLSAGLLDNRLNTARVVVAFTVSVSGEVTNLTVASTSDTRLNRSVLRAVQAWRYAPIPEPREHMVSFAFTSE